MPIEKKVRATGSPTWIDVMVSDPEASQRFYGELFGWEFDSPLEKFGGYVLARSQGAVVAGIGPTRTGPDGPIPAFWTTYVAVEDADAIAAKVDAAGGRILVAPYQVGEEGRQGVMMDPEGAVFGLWQAGRHTGCEILDEHGALTWSEILIRDYEQAEKFYGTVFGYGFTDLRLDDKLAHYAIVSVGHDEVAGLGRINPQWPDDVPGHWQVYFNVDDIERSARKVLDLGGLVVAPIEEAAYGWIARVVGPDREVFCLQQEKG